MRRVSAAGGFRGYGGLSVSLPLYRAPAAVGDASPYVPIPSCWGRGRRAAEQLRAFASLSEALRRKKVGQGAGPGWRKRPWGKGDDRKALRLPRLLEHLSKAMGCNHSRRNLQS